VQREAVRRRAGTYLIRWTSDQQRTTPQVRRVAQRPGNASKNKPARQMI
jgi:hypothetical protein